MPVVRYRFQTRPVEPNPELLEAALAQTRGAQQDGSRWHELILEGLDEVDFGSIRYDVAPFLEDSSKADLLTASNLRRLIV